MKVQKCFGLTRADRFDSKILTWPALVPYDEVLASSWAWVCTKQPAIDEKLAAPPVLTLIQHLLQSGMHTRNRETTALQYLHQRDRQTERNRRTARSSLPPQLAPAQGRQWCSVQWVPQELWTSKGLNFELFKVAGFLSLSCRQKEGSALGGSQEP